MYRNRDNLALWVSKTHEKNGQFALMEEDGNLGIYDTAYDRVWSSYTYTDIGAFLMLQDDGNLVRQFGWQ